MLSQGHLPAAATRRVPAPAAVRPVRVGRVARAATVAGPWHATNATRNSGRQTAISARSATPYAAAFDAVLVQATFGERKVAGGRFATCARRLSIKISVRAPDFTARTSPAARRRYSSDLEMPESRTASGIGTASGSMRRGSVVILHIPRCAGGPPALRDIQIDDLALGVRSVVSSPASRLDTTGCRVSRQGKA